MGDAPIIQPRIDISRQLPSHAPKCPEIIAGMNLPSFKEIVHKLNWRLVTLQTITKYSARPQPIIFSALKMKHISDRITNKT